MPEETRDPTVFVPGAVAHPVRILLFRHGAAEGSEDGRFISRTDVSLLPEGMAQIRASAARARRWLTAAEAVPVYSSPLLRARESAAVLLRELGLAEKAPRIVEAFLELDLGRWEGETQASLTAKEPERLRAHYADFVHSQAPGGESLMDLAERVRPAFRKIREETAGSVAIVVAHAAVNRVIVLDALGAPLENFFRIEIGLGSFCVLDFHGEMPLVRLMNG